MEVSRTDSIALPVELVELQHLKSKDGAPVVVRCEALGELALAEVFQALPGGRPRVVEANEAGEVDPVEQMRAMNEWAPALIEAGTVLVGPKGEEVRPAFYFETLNGKPRPRHPLSQPGRMLRENDKALLVAAIMRLGGYGGAAEAEVFPAERSGADDGVGAVEAGKGKGRTAAPAHGEKAHAS